MRVWLDPNKLNNYQLTPVDVTNVIKVQNAQIAAGQLGVPLRLRASNSMRR
jgi:multidrug efflux pump